MNVDPLDAEFLAGDSEDEAEYKNNSSAGKGGNGAKGSSITLLPAASSASSSSVSRWGRSKHWAPKLDETRYFHLLRRSQEVNDAYLAPVDWVLLRIWNVW